MRRWFSLVDGSRTEFPLQGAEMMGDNSRQMLFTKWTFSAPKEAKNVDEFMSDMGLVEIFNLKIRTSTPEVTLPHLR